MNSLSVFGMETHMKYNREKMFGAKYPEYKCLDGGFSHQFYWIVPGSSHFCGCSFSINVNLTCASLCFPFVSLAQTDTNETHVWCAPVHIRGRTPLMAVSRRTRQDPGPANKSPLCQLKRWSPADSSCQRVPDGWWQTITRVCSLDTKPTQPAAPLSRMGGRKEEHLTNDPWRLRVSPQVDRPITLHTFLPMQLPATFSSSFISRWKWNHSTFSRWGKHILVLVFSLKTTNMTLNWIELNALKL